MSAGYLCAERLEYVNVIGFLAFYKEITMGGKSAKGRKDKGNKEAKKPKKVRTA